MKCKNVGCRHCNPNKTCSRKNISLDEDGKCSLFEKGIVYYIHLVWDALEHGNVIPLNLLTEDLKIGLFYVMDIWNLHFSDCTRGGWRWVMLKESPDGPGLNYQEIINRDWDFEKFQKHKENLDKGILPGPKTEPEEPKKTSQPFGWLSPSGDFTVAGFADHEDVAQKLIRMRYFLTEYEAEYAMNHTTGRDFLADIKGYCLIHNPSNDGSYIVSHAKPLTKKQKEFLYGYFVDMGDKLRAESYLED